jgi:hypothetical protein
MMMMMILMMMIAIIYYWDFTEMGCDNINCDKMGQAFVVVTRPLRSRNNWKFLESVNN